MQKIKSQALAREEKNSRAKVISPHKNQMVAPLAEIDHEIISMTFSSLPLIQDGLLSVTSKSMCMKYLLAT